ncbi:MAG: GerMN domain-containing protein [Alkalispirochaeta sp.]
MGKERSRKKSSFGVVFWIAAILLVLIIFLFNLPAIREVLTTTGFVEVVFEERDQDTPEDSVGPEDTGSEESVPLPAPDETEVDPDTPESPGATENESGDPTVSDEPDDPVVDADEEDPQEIVVEPPADPETESTERTRSVTLFFIRVTDDGRIVAEPVQRTIRFSGGPLTHAIQALISGPNAEDLNKGLLSLIPQGTELISARVSDGVAYLNFNEAFRFNTMGLEGYLAQMQQIVHTATVFSTVDAVQILIEGEQVDYLGGDGVYVAEPITPADLR